MNEDDRVTLREFILVQLKAVEERFAQYIQYSNERLNRTEAELNRRLEGMNEFREENRRERIADRDVISRMTATFVTKDNYDVQLQRIEEAIGDLKQWRDNVTGRYVMLAGVLTVFLVLLGLAIRWWR